MEPTPRLSAEAAEHLRLQRLSELAIVDTPSEAEFDTIVELAHRLFDCPIALVSLVDGHRQWFKARCGLEAEGTAREHAFCAHSIMHDEIMVVEDATKDARFADNPLVIGPPHIRFYAGAPLRPAGDGAYGDLPAIGTLCVIATEPRTLAPEDRQMLRRLADMVEGLIAARAATAAAIRISDQLRRQAQLLERANKQLRQAEKMANIGSWRIDVATGAITWSDEVYAIHGLDVVTPPPVATAVSFYPDPDRDRLRAAIAHASATGEGFDLEADFRTAAGAMRRVRSLGEVELAEGRPVAIIGLFQDITDRHLHEQELHRTANTDSLTGLPNRKMFEDRLARETSPEAQEPGPYAILLIDLDGFKSVNDTLGHQAGDEVLRNIGERLRGPIFSHAFAARLGGDEFVILITRPRDCAKLPQLIQAVLRELRHMVERSGVRRAITATVGAALSEDGSDTPHEMLRRADLALYAAKRAERGSGSIYGAGDKIGPWSIFPGRPKSLLDDGRTSAAA
ncbi:sensor domain-containing diguanylate cyclase [Sphingomonas profundi]|uniref:sensor domain-containing diguanylate cyclase n=1 Tax=Alterirhizorhabdus profundi TaxID=2681549 RepID=UPI0012E947EE|nr:diguanylate cyclase [Sphingomonas profundi]